MKILFIGPKFGNSYLQYLTLKRIYKNVDFIDTFQIFKFKKISTYLFIHLTPLIFENKINKYILTKIKKNYDLIYVKSGEFIGKKLIVELKKKTKKIVFFCNDNPFVKRDKQRWRLFMPAGKYYDLIVFQDESRVKLSRRYGINKTLLVLPPYDKKIHIKQKISNRVAKKIKNEIVFVGTWSIEKSIFLRKLIDLGLDIKIFGSRWYKDPNYNNFKDRISLGHLYNNNYTKVIQTAKIALCLFEKKNLDTITARSIEIPAIGTFLCSMRTRRMKKYFVENKEAVFFSNATECANKCKYYLNHPKELRKIAKMGNAKVIKILKPSNDNLLKKIINKAFM